MHGFEIIIPRADTGSLKWDKYAGKDILPLWVADMDFASPPAVLEALRARVDHGVFGYTIPDDNVTHAVLDYLHDRHGIHAQPNWLVWSPGLVPALNLACRATGHPGSGVLINTPVYPPFLSAPPFSDRKRISVPLIREDEQWQIDWAAMEAAVSPTTALMILCHPHNPVGRVWRRDELERIVDFCARHNLTLVSDEIHCDLILEDLPHVATLTLSEEARRRTIALYSPSKTYNLPGLACSYAVIPDESLRSAFTRTARGIITEINALGYVGCAAAYQHGEPWRKELVRYLRDNRDLVFSFVRDRLPGVIMHPMEATYLAWLDVRGLALEQPAAFFESAGVGLSNGVDFGAPGFLRLNFGCPRETLTAALERMAVALSAPRSA
ncbi:MAG TPA: PatB family C-S lyase [Kiritimatiellia bacterium]|nr:PatB family C-S lyase [Kiritimatiellia bacterium]HMO98995.1 PatB family C-S lyase [Kiritimatiellia bacterium]HMP95882.1 PatB family C-S lyase [Kiritimatiellia bacterium]